MLAKKEIENWLRETDHKKLESLWEAADNVRKKHVGDTIHLRGLLEISNYCARKCAYCGIHKDRKDISRYRMSEKEIMECINTITELGYGTVVMQAGEDYGLTKDFISNIIKKIKNNTALALTLSLGERSFAELQEWKKAGADRYLLRFETSAENLYSLIHPALTKQEPPLQRFKILEQLRNIGYEIGSGVMVGIPGQTYEILANDIYNFYLLDLDMIGIGPYIKSPQTALGLDSINIPDVGNEQVPATELMTYKAVALARLVCPEANIPSTTALATINKASGRELGLKRGANIVMPNITPMQYRKLYEIYPHKACINEDAKACAVCMQKRIEMLGRTIGTGPGKRIKQKDNNS
jgi:biotin synthase